jgi:hypothetical protein
LPQELHHRADNGAGVFAAGNAEMLGYRNMSAAELVPKRWLAAIRDITRK